LAAYYKEIKMSLQPREIPEVQEIARQIAKEEIEAMDNKDLKPIVTKLEAVITDLETKMAEVEATDLKLEAEIKDLKTELKRVEKMKEPEKPTTKSFSRK